MENELFSQIKSGLNGDEQIILSPVDAMAEGTPITPLPGSAPMGL
ncbi:hypothetical protein [Brevibacillus nitrificans]|nr:hypothetical protein [Brevibacillus nitrificans]MDR7315402.1 hypothetical protein [Brevibacillus nitrificans]